MKVQITLLLNVEIDRSDYIKKDDDTDDTIREAFQLALDDGQISFDDIIEQSSDYTVTVVEAPAT